MFYCTSLEAKMVVKYRPEKGITSMLKQSIWMWNIDKKF